MARVLYSSRVRAKAVKLAVRDPRAALLLGAGEGSLALVESVARSFRIEVLSLSAELNAVFYRAKVSRNSGIGKRADGEVVGGHTMIARKYMSAAYRAVDKIENVER